MRLQLHIKFFVITAKTRNLCSLTTNLVFRGMFLLLHFGQGDLQIVDVLLKLGAFVFKLPLLGGQLSGHFLLVLQPLGHLFEFGFELDFALDQAFTSLLCIAKIFRVLKKKTKKEQQ